MDKPTKFEKGLAVGFICLLVPVVFLTVKHIKGAVADHTVATNAAEAKSLAATLKDELGKMQTALNNMVIDVGVLKTETSAARKDASTAKDKADQAMTAVAASQRKEVSNAATTAQPAPTVTPSAAASPAPNDPSRPCGSADINWPALNETPPRLAFQQCGKPATKK